MAYEKININKDVKPFNFKKELADKNISECTVESIKEYCNEYHNKDSLDTMRNFILHEIKKTKKEIKNNTDGNECRYLRHRIETYKLVAKEWNIDLKNSESKKRPTLDETTMITNIDKEFENNDYDIKNLISKNAELTNRIAQIEQNKIDQSKEQREKIKLHINPTQLVELTIALIENQNFKKENYKSEQKLYDYLCEVFSIDKKIEFSSIQTKLKSRYKDSFLNELDTSFKRKIQRLKDKEQ